MVESIIAVLVLLAGIAYYLAVGLVRKGREVIPAYLKPVIRITVTSTIFGIVAIPALTVIKMMTGWAWPIYGAAFPSIILTLGLGLLWSPLALVIGTILGPTNPVEVGERYLRTIGVIVFAELIISRFLLIVPFHHNLGMLPTFLMAGAALALATVIWGGLL